MNLSYLPPIAPSRPPRAALHIRYGLQLLLHHLLHADRVHQQFEILDDFKLMAGDIAFDGTVLEQLGKVALGDHQVEQVYPIVFFGILVLGLDLAHFLFKPHDFPGRPSCL